MSVENTNEARELIQGWMDDRGFFDAVLSPAPIPEGFHFIIGGKAANGLPFSVLQPDELIETVMVIANVSLSKEHFDAFNDLNAKDRDMLLWNLQRDIMFKSPTYSFNSEFQTDGTFKGIQFTKEISYDELTKGKLGDAVIDVTRCVLWVIWTFGREFGALKE
jgi:hypothetical protein